MITRTAYAEAQRRAAELLRRTGLVLSVGELGSIAVADFGLSELEQSGGQILTLLNTDEIAVKLIALFPGQTLPEHRHPPLGDYPGKAETLRCEWGEVYLYVPGPVTVDPMGDPPAHRLPTYTVWHEYILRPGDQVTFPPNTPHWFQGGPEGTVFWSFSTKVIDKEDKFTDPDIQRETVIVD